MLELLIGSKNYSSWSLRPWLSLKHKEIPFKEVVISMHQATWREQARSRSPNGKVPMLQDGALQVPESLAILEYIAECFPAAQLWPKDLAARATARAVSAEMHSGFAHLRQEMSVNILARKNVVPSDKACADIARIEALWAECRTRFGAAGPFLFGEFSNADAMFAPVVTRFVTYEIPVSEATQAYMATILALPAMEAWIQGAQEEAARGEGGYR